MIRVEAPFQESTEPLNTIIPIEALAETYMTLEHQKENTSIKTLD
jgi:hypothetical protein